MRTLLCLAVLPLLPQALFAECIPGEDPCAPKKVVGAWDSSIAGGFNLTRGNSETLALNLSARAYKEEGQNIYDLSGSYDYGEDSTDKTEDQESTTKNEVRGAGRYDYLLTDKTFAGFGATYLYDEMADIDYRVTLDPGLGYYLLKDSTYKFRIEAGPSYVFERQGGEDNNYLAPKIGDRFEWAISCTSKIYQSASALFDVDDSENYIINAEAGVESALAANLALVFTVRNTYDNVPAEDREKNDLAMITALKVSL